jgi:hypothetical protein
MRKTIHITLLLLSSVFLFYACEDVTNSTIDTSDNIQSAQVQATPQVQTMSAEKPVKIPSGAVSVPYQYAKPGTDAPTTIFSSMEPGASNSFSSFGYQAQGIIQSGDYIKTSQLGVLYSVDVGMSSWACESGGWNTGDCLTSDGATFDHPITLNIYEVDNSGSTPALGSLITSKTQTFSIPFRPSADDELCEDEKRFYDERVEACLNGLNTEITFDFSDDSIILPEEFIYGIEYNTQTYGDNPVGVSGPYNSLNFALIDKTDYPVSVGEDVQYGDFLFELSSGFFGLVDYGDFGLDFPYTGAIEFNEKTTKDDCKKGGWADLGFKNQGKCIQYVNTGKDSR